MSTRQGIYAGRTAEQRQAERRERLVTAARDIWGEQGWAAVSMRGVCARAGVVDRYFYENFADRDELLVAVWDQIRDHLVGLAAAAVTAASADGPAEQIRAAIAAVVGYFDADPRQTRIVLSDNSGSAVLRSRRRQALHTFTDLIVDLARPYTRPDTDENAMRMSTLMGVGGFVELVAAWNDGLISAGAAQIIDHAASVGADLGHRHLRSM